jgi:hypothetical protein
MYETIHTEIRDQIAILTFSRLDKLNAMNRTVFRELGDFLDRIHSGEQPASVLILTGDGRAFVAGADIDDYVTMTIADFSAFQRYGRGVLEKIECLPCPVIAAVNGYAFGGGFELALTCDIILASENAKFALPEAKLGLLPGGGGTQRLPRIVGLLVDSGAYAPPRPGRRRDFHLRHHLAGIPAGGQHDDQVRRLHAPRWAVRLYRHVLHRLGRYYGDGRCHRSPGGVTLRLSAETVHLQHHRSS